MKLWEISQDTVVGHDTYSSAVVVAESVEDAQHIHPNRSFRSKYAWNVEQKVWIDENGRKTYDWAAPQDVVAECIGTAVTRMKAGTVVCAGFDAG